MMTQVATNYKTRKLETLVKLIASYACMETTVAKYTFLSIT